MSKSNKKFEGEIELRIGGEVVRQIRQHARGASQTEVCGVLIGGEEGRRTVVKAAIAGLEADQGGSYVTFTQDTWEHIYRIKDRDYPEERIVGWYHSHPGFGVFLSDHDTFIHQNFFSSPQQVAWVYDPHSDEEGCFGWIGERLQRLSRVVVADEKGGEEAGETGKPEPALAKLNEGSGEEAGDEGARKSKRTVIADAAFLVLTHLTVLVAGGLLCWQFFPRLVPIPVVMDPLTGKYYVLPMSEAVPSAGQPQAGGGAGAPTVNPQGQVPAGQGEKGKP